MPPELIETHKDQQLTLTPRIQPPRPRLQPIPHRHPTKPSITKQGITPRRLFQSHSYRFHSWSTVLLLIRFPRLVERNITRIREWVAAAAGQLGIRVRVVVHRETAADSEEHEQGNEEVAKHCRACCSCLGWLLVATVLGLSESE